MPCCSTQELLQVQSILVHWSLMTMSIILGHSLTVAYVVENGRGILKTERGQGNLNILFFSQEGLPNECAI